MSRYEMEGFRRVGRREFVEMCAGSLALAAVGCAPRGNKTPAKDSTVTVLFPGNERISFWDQTAAQHLIFLALAVPNSKGELERQLAESWEHSPDYRTWTIHLRKDVQWHDGVPVTAHDVKFTLDLFMHPAMMWESPAAYSVDVIDDSTYRIDYHGRADYGRPWEEDCYLPKHLLENLDPKEYANWEFWTHPVGNGAYRYVRHVPNTMVELEANPRYYRGKPKIERVVLKFGDTSASGALTELLSGNVDAVDYVNRLDILSLGADSRFRLYDYIGEWNPKAIAWNQHHPLFREPRVRRALTLAINRRELLQVLNLPEMVPIFDAPFRERQFRRNELPKPVPYDPALAKRLLEEVGWHDIGGLRQRNGKPFQFTALVPATELLDLDKAAVYIQAQLRRVGVQMGITSLDLETEEQRLKADEFEAALVVMNESFLKPPYNYFGFFGYFADNSLIGYSNPQLTALLRKAEAAMDPDEIDRFYREFVPIFQADLPMTFLYPNVLTAAVHRRVRGLSSPWRADPVKYIENLWLEEES